MLSGNPRSFALTRTAALVAASLTLSLAACSSNDDGDGGSMPAPLQGLGIPADGSGGFSEGVVTAANPIAAEAGAQVLRDGGNAVDAAAVVQFVLNVVEPTSSGIGGGGFMGVHLAESGRTFFIDSREKAPAAASPTQFLVCDPDCGDADLAEERLLSTDENGDGFSFTDVATSGIGVGVPGTLLGVDHALREYGTLSLAQALAPAIALARDGFAINDRLAMLTDSARTAAWPETAALWRDANGEPLAEGVVVVQTDLANTFQAIADNGVDAFYTGDIAQAIVDAQTRARESVGEDGAGRMTLADLTAYRDAGIDERDPVAFDYRGFTINGMPSPSSGGYTTAQILHCLENFPLGDASQGFGQGTTATLNVMVESMRVAFSSRSRWMGDIDFVDLPIAGLLSDGYLDERCAPIAADGRLDNEAVLPGDPRAFDPAFDVAAAAVSNGEEGPVGIDTTHFSIIDQNGNVVSWTSTIEGTWGSGMTVPGHGFLLNNELTDFNFRPQLNEDAADFAPGANDVAPGKRPRSSMAPTLVFQGDAFRAAYGSPGGSTIINSVVNTTVNLIDHGLSVQDAIDAPRISVTSPTGSVAYEAGFDAAALDGLTALGHTLRDEPSSGIGSVQAVVVDPMTMLQYGGADSRRAGAVVGLPDAQ